MSQEQQINRDSFKLFDLSKFFNPLDNRLSIREEIKTFSFSFCNLTGHIFKDILNDKYYVGVCTESEYYLNDLEENEYSIIRRFLICLVPPSCFSNNRLNIAVTETYLLNRIDQFIFKKIIEPDFFIFDECSSDSYLTRLFYLDESQLRTYFEYAFQTERYFLASEYNVINPYVQSFHFRNYYLEAKDKILETSISDYLSFQIQITIQKSIDCCLFPFQKKPLKIFKNVLKSKFSSIISNDHKIINEDNFLSFGFLQLNNGKFYLWFKTEMSLPPQPHIERHIIFEISQEQAFSYAYISDNEIYNLFFHNLINYKELTVLELNHNHHHFHFIYNLDLEQDKQKYLSFLMMPIQQKIQTRHNHQTHQNYVNLKEKPYTNILLNLQNDMHAFLGFKGFEYDNCFPVTTKFQRENLFINKITGAKYFFNTLTFKDGNDLSSKHMSFFSRKDQEHILLFENQIIGFIQQQSLFSISDEDYHKFIKFNKFFNTNDNFHIEDVIDKYEFMQNKTIYKLYYIEFIDGNNIINNYGLLFELKAKNLFKDAQIILDKFSLF